jgi:DNA polymerase III epsilon subunit-like protein
MSQLSRLQDLAARYQQVKRRYGHLLMKEFFVLDTETTGLLQDPVTRATQPVGVASVSVARWNPRTKRFTRVLRDDKGNLVRSLLFNPDQPMEAAAQAVHGLDPAMLAKHKPFASHAEALSKVLQGKVVVGHNINFDLEILDQNLARVNRGLAAGQKIASPKLQQVVDTWHLARAYYPVEERTAASALFQRPSALENVARAFGIEHVAHEAGEDVLATGRMFEQMLRGGRPTGLDVWGFDPDLAGSAQVVMPKHRPTPKSWLPDPKLTGAERRLAEDALQSRVLQYQLAFRKRIEAATPGFDTLRGLMYERNLPMPAGRGHLARAAHSELWGAYFKHPEYKHLKQKGIDPEGYLSWWSQHTADALPGAKRPVSPVPKTTTATVERKVGLKAKSLSKWGRLKSSPIALGAMIGATVYGAGWLLGAWDAKPEQRVPQGYAGMVQHTHNRVHGSLSKIVNPKVKYGHLFPTRAPMTQQPGCNYGQRRESAAGIHA